MRYCLIESRELKFDVSGRLFLESFENHKKRVKNLPERLERFINFKKDNPFKRYGKHDYPFTGPLQGYNHVHLADDTILVYKIKNDILKCLMIISHEEILGTNRAKQIKTKLDSITEQIKKFLDKTNEII